MHDTLTRTDIATPAAAAAPRLDLYQGIHKALRLLYADTLTQLGSVDADDDGALAMVLAQCGDLLALLALHYDDEDRFVHPALERAQPGCTGRIEAEHVRHRDALDALRERVEVVRVSHGATRAAALARLYGALALVMAEDLEHMHFEDIELNAVLWRHYSDADLAAIHDALVASIPPQMMLLALRWMLPALNAAERAGLLLGARDGMPPEAFAAALALARERLTLGEWRKLALALQVQA
jgi:hypothetical protein